MNEEGETNKERYRPCWQNCGALYDESLLAGKEILAIDAMEDSIGPLDNNTMHIRGLITGLEPCYHEVDVDGIGER